MNTSKVVIFAALISANMVIWFEALGPIGIFLFLLALAIFLFWRKEKKI